MIARFVCLLRFPLSLKLVSNKHFHNKYIFTNRLRRKANTLPIQESGLGTLGSLEGLVGNRTKKVQTFIDFVNQVLDFFLFLGG